MFESLLNKTQKIEINQTNTEIFEVNLQTVHPILSTKNQQQQFRKKNIYLNTSSIFVDIVSTSLIFL